MPWTLTAVEKQTGHEFPIWTAATRADCLAKLNVLQKNNQGGWKNVAQTETIALSSIAGFKIEEDPE